MTRKRVFMVPNALLPKFWYHLRYGNARSSPRWLFWRNIDMFFLSFLFVRPGKYHRWMLRWWWISFSTSSNNHNNIKSRNGVQPYQKDSANKADMVAPQPIKPRSENASRFPWWNQNRHSGHIADVSSHTILDRQAVLDSAFTSSTQQGIECQKLAI